MRSTADAPAPDHATVAPGPRPSHAALMVAFYLGVPMCLAIVMAWNPTGMRAPRMQGPFLPAVYWLGILLPLWALLDLSAHGLRSACRRLSVRLPFVLLLVASALLATLLMRPYLIYYWAMVDHLLDPVTARPLSALAPPWPQSVAEFLQTVRRAGFLLAVWTAVNLFYLHALGVPRYGYSRAEPDRTLEDEGPPVEASLSLVAPGAAAPANGADPAALRAPAFLERLGRDGDRDILVLQAQDHYLRVTTATGSALVLYRFSDAVREMDSHGGIRAHRSYWVARSAVKRLIARGGRHFLLLTNGERVPVSRTYLEDVRRQLH